MKQSHRITATMRAAGIIAGVLAAASGITFAALQSQPAKLTGNTIETATANLQLSTDGTNFSSSLAGFDFSNIVPGGPAQGGYSFNIKNSGSTPVTLKLAVSSAPSNPDNVDLSKVNLLLTPTGGSTQSFNLQALITSAASGGLAITSPSQLFVGNRIQFTVQISMAVDAINGPSAVLSNIDLALSGLAVSN